jgi:hypothetical protein
VTATTVTSTQQKFSVQLGTGGIWTQLLTRYGAVKAITGLVKNVIVCVKPKKPNGNKFLNWTNALLFVNLQTFF